MIIYEPGTDHDLFLLNAYQNIAQAKDFDKLLTKNAHTLTGFFDIFKRPTVTFIGGNTDLGVWFLGWATPCFNGALYGQWVHPKKRPTKECLKTSLQVWNTILKACPTIVGLTKQPEHIREHLKLGYQVVGILPHLWDGENVTALVLTREGFAPVRERFHKFLEIA